MGEQTKSILDGIWQFFNVLKLPCKFSGEEFQDEDLKRIFERILNVMIGLFFHAIRPCYEAKKKEIKAANSYLGMIRVPSFPWQSWK